jgi:aldehyde dehydrogenase (NAD+)
MKIAPALAAGCSVVLKPAEQAPLFVAGLEEILGEAGIPTGVVNCVNGLGRTAGAALAAHPDVDKIAFTGSTRTGKSIVEAATGNLKKVMLELGGKSPVLVFEDADIEKAAKGAAMGIFINSGQGCICGSRIYVHARVRDVFVEKLVAEARAVRLGGSHEENVDIGPLITEQHMNRVLGYIEGGRKEGAEILTGGSRIDRPGFFVEPTVLANVRDDMRVQHEEIFGPVVTVSSFEDEDEAVALANHTDLGLAAAVWTRDLARGHRMAKAIQAGTVWLNCQLVLDPCMPFGGYKQSGWGRERSLDGIEAYMETKSVYADLQS